MTKKKILFYGNCQLEVLAHCLKSNKEFMEKYEFIRASETKCESIWKSEFTFASWKYRKNCPIFGSCTPEVVEDINKSIDKADIVFFNELQSAPHIERPEEITTRYLYENNKQKHFVCIPNFWFNGYFMSEKHQNCWFLDVVNILMIKGMTAREIYEWFLFGEDFMDDIKTLKETLYKNCSTELTKRMKTESLYYPNYINMLYLLYNYEKNLLSYYTNHPSTFYFKHLYKNVIEHMDSNISTDLEESSMEVVGTISPYIGDFKFFNILFPNIENMNFHKKFFHSRKPFDLETIRDHIIKIKELMDTNSI